MRRSRSIAGMMVGVLISLVLSAGAWAAGFGNSNEQLYLEHLFKGQSAGTAPTSMWLSLHDGTPTEGNPCGGEISGGGYARVQLNADSTTSAGNWSAIGAGAGTAQRISNNQVVTFPTATADWNSAGAIESICIHSASTGGTCYICATISAAGVTVLNGNTLSFPVGAIDFDLD